MFKITVLHPDGLPTAQRYQAMAALALGTALTLIDNYSLNAALPAIAADLNVSPATAVRLANAYQLAITVALFPLAAIGDRLGYRRVYVGGLALLAVTSMLCAFAPDFTTLTIARLLQGLAAAGVVSVAAGLIRHVYPATLLGRGIGIQASVVATSAACGPLFAGLVLSFASWRWIFALTPLLSAASLIIAVRTLPRNETTRASFDLRGAVLSAATIGLFVVALNAFSFGQSSWGFSLAAFLLAAVIGTALVRHELDHPLPLLPVDLFRRPVFSLSVGTAACAFIAQMLLLVTLPFYLHQEIGLNVATAGLCIAPWPLALAVMAPIAGTLSDRYSTGKLGGLGLTVVAAGAVLIGLLPANAHVADILWRIALCGAGFGLFQSPNNKLIISSTPLRRTSAAGAVISTVRLTGQMIGVSLAALIFALAPVSGKHVAIFLAAGIAVSAALLSISRALVKDQQQAAGAKDRETE